MSITSKAMLVILDGWGIGQDPTVDAIAQADTPFYDNLLRSHPSASLVTFGKEVGLPQGQMGNSEVGHLNIGAGRVVYQDLARINKAIEEDTLVNEAAIQNMIRYAKENDKKVHILGLLSDGGVHAHINHLKAIIDILENEHVQEVKIHAFLDGRDTAPDSGKGYTADILEFLEGKNANLATLIGRYYAMDRDNRWPRIKRAYDLLVHGIGDSSDDPLMAIQTSYDAGITDEFLDPILLDEDARIEGGDVVFFINYRSDRPRQLVKVLSQEQRPEDGMATLPLYFVTMTRYDASYVGVKEVFKKDLLPKTLGQVVAESGLSQVRIAETEKYPHVTFFFSGGQEEPFVREERILIPSPPVATYDLAPEMGTAEITDAICSKIVEDTPDFICLNYASPDMVGHTGDFTACQTAIEVVDQSLRRLVPIALSHGIQILIIADHGNSDIMINPDGSPHTAHTTNLVPVIYVSRDEEQRELASGKLADVAPTIIAMMKLEQPAEMTGRSLLA